MRNKLKILITTEVYPPIITGSGIAVTGLAVGLAKRGHKVAVVCPGKSIRDEIHIESGVTIHRLSSLPLPVIFHNEIRVSPFPKKYIKNLFKEFNPDIIHITDHHFISSAAFSLAKKNKIKVIGTNYFTPYNWLDNFIIKKNSQLYRITSKILWYYFVKLYNKIDVVTVPTFFSKKQAQDVGIKKSIEVISCGIDLKQYKKNEIDKNIFAKYKIKENKLTLLSVSRLDKEKRVDLLLNAIYLIKDKIDFQFIITGRGKEKENLEKLVIEKNLSERVIFTDVVSDLELKNLYKISDIFLTASEVELQGLSIMEAMASGLPVIAASSMAIPELVKDGFNGFLFEPGKAMDASEKILRLATDRDLIKKMSLASSKLIREHCMEVTLDRFEEIYYENLS
ncbi:MAG: glycosyltransferase [Actinobacteria bacterium]|nr:glycosyltransferase [Actinomycetota bacterium]